MACAEGSRQLILCLVRPMKPSAREIGFTTLPSAVMLALYYSLAVHMYFTLGGWPTDIGERGFPPALVAHVYVTTSYCAASAVAAVFLLPFVMIVCAIVERWQRFVPHLIIAAVLLVSCFVFTQVGAPSGFLYWWHD